MTDEEHLHHLFAEATRIRDMYRQAKSPEERTSLKRQYDQLDLEVAQIKAKGTHPSSDQRSQRRGSSSGVTAATEKVGCESCGAKPASARSTTSKTDGLPPPTVNSLEDESKGAAVKRTGHGRGTETVMLPGDVPLDMVWIPPGTFLMGRYPGEQDSDDNEDPQHQVTLTQGFWLGKYVVTKRQWTAVMGTTPWAGQSYALDDPDSPAVHVSWSDAQAFMTALSTYTGQTFRLPSEAQWEYACRGGTTTRFYWGDDPSYTLKGNYAWYEVAALHMAGLRYAQVAGLKQPNAWGLYDMSGNVWEWCQDWFHDNYAGAPVDGSAWESPVSLYHVLRGGSWFSGGLHCRSAFRNGRCLDYPDIGRGFRVVRTP